MRDKGKILIEGMDLSGKTTIVNTLKEITDVKRINARTLSNSTEIYDFTVAQSKKRNMPEELISKLYNLAIYEDLYNYTTTDNGIILQDSYFALRSFALAKHNHNEELAQEIYDLLKLFPTPDKTFYLFASTDERIRRNLKRDKPMAYMERLLMSNPEEFADIENYLRNATIELFDAELINTEEFTPEEIALYINDKIDEINFEEEVENDL